ncbi:hypothetical protein [Embleya sp. NPDC059259]|uniref:hypothetical protein n=1 Tax=unclassified Embleya TaxID=2699296 RepID=UPI0036886DBF
MGAGVRGVVEESQRAVWSFARSSTWARRGSARPTIRRPAAVDGVLEAIGTRGYGAGRVTRADPWPAHGTGGSGIPSAGVTPYHDRSIGPAGIAIDARRGPRVRLDDIPLVGRTPSRLE